MAAAFARYELTRRVVPAIVGSAGFLEGGAPAAPGAVRSLRERGLDLSSHVSAQIDPLQLAEADAIITAEGAHVLEVAAIDPCAAQRAMPLRSLVDQVVEPAEEPLGPSELRSWIVESRRGLDHVLDPRFDLPDPMGGSVRRFRRSAELIAGLVNELCDGWFGRPSAR